MIFLRSYQRADVSAQCDLEKAFFGDGKGELVEFGHDQCKRTVLLSTTSSLMRLGPGILVRDDSARERLKERLGGGNIIM